MKSLNEIKKIVPFGVEGARVNLGKKGGVAALRKDIPYHSCRLSLLATQT